MKLLNLAVLKLLAYLITGILVGYYVPEAITEMLLLQVGAFLFCMLGLSLSCNRKHLFEVICGLLFLNIGLYGSHTNLTPPRPAIATPINKPISVHIYVLQELPATKYYYRYLGSVSPEKSPEEPLQTILKIRKSPKTSKPLSPGRYYRGVARLNLPAPPYDKHAFNYREYLRKKGIHVTAEIQPTTILTTGKRSLLRYRMHQLKTKLTHSLESRGFTPFTLGLVKALVLGDRSELSPDFYHNLRSIGGAHLIALSGLHIGILVSFTGFLLWPLRRLKNGAVIHFVLLSIFLVFYIFLVGASASVVRAGVMCVFLFFSVLLQDRGSVLNTLIASAFILLLFHPLYLFDVGFQLSYAALTGIVLLSRLWNRLWKPKNKIIRFIRGLITVTISAQLFTAPLTLYYFHQFPTSFLLTNLVLTPLVMIFLPAAYLTLIAMMSGIISEPLTMLINHLGKAIKMSTYALRLESVLPAYSTSIETVQVFLLYAFLCSMVWFAYRKQTLLLIPMCILFIQVWQISTLPTQQPDQLVIGHHYKKSSIRVIRNQQQRVYDYTEKDRLSDTEDSMNYFFKMGSESLLVITTDEFKFTGLPASSHILLTNSTRINLDRLLNDLRPIRVIADGSNYPDLVSRWRLSCIQKNIPFHYTGEKGYYIIKP